MCTFQAARNVTMGHYPRTCGMWSDTPYPAATPTVMPEGTPSWSIQTRAKALQKISRKISRSGWHVRRRLADKERDLQAAEAMVAEMREEVEQQGELRECWIEVFDVQMNEDGIGC